MKNQDEKALVKAKGNQRRYYLKQALKSVLSISSHSKEVIVTDHLIDGLPEKSRKHLYELRDRFGYNLQYTIV